MLCLCKVRNKFLVNFWNSTILLCTPCIFNLLTPNDHYSGRTAPLISKCCILYIYSTNISTKYFKHGIYSAFFSSSKCSLFHNSNGFGSFFIHILYKGCAKIKKNNSGAKRLMLVFCKPVCQVHSLVFSLVGRAWQEPKPSHVTGMALAHCILDRFLGVVCHCFPPTFRCSHFSRQVTPSATTREILAVKGGTMGRKMSGSNFA